MKRLIPTAVLAGIGTAALAGAALAQGLPMHRMTVRLPDGGVAQIAYSGPTAPEVRIVPAPALAADFAPLSPAPPGRIFADMQRISADMDREAARMWHEAAAMMAQPWPGPEAMLKIDAATLPPNAQMYSAVSTATPGGVCSESLAVIGEGAGHAPKVIRKRTGDCGTTGGAGAMAAPGEAPVWSAPPPAAARPDLREVKATMPAPAAAPWHEVAWSTRY